MQKRIVIVDDTKEQIEILGEYLEILGYKAIDFEDPEMAIAHIEKENADLILMDQQLSKHMNGWEAVKIIREKRPEQRVVIMSGYEIEDFDEDLSANDVDGFLKKPFMLSELSNLLAEVFTNRN